MCLTHYIINPRIRLCEYCIDNKHGCPDCHLCKERLSWSWYYKILNNAFDLKTFDIFDDKNLAKVHKLNKTVVCSTCNTNIN